MSPIGGPWDTGQPYVLVPEPAAACYTCSICAERGYVVSNCANCGGNGRIIRRPENERG